MSKKRSFEEIRKSKGITQKHIYTLLGIARQTLYNKETFKTDFTALEAQKLCDEYDVDILDVLLKKA